VPMAVRSEGGGDGGLRARGLGGGWGGEQRGAGEALPAAWDMVRDHLSEVRVKRGSTKTEGRPA